MAVSNRPKPPRVVVDTNVVLSALLFNGAVTSEVKQAWQRGLCLPVISRATTEELIEALSYPKFRLTRDQQENVLAEYLPYCETLADPKTRAKLPECRDGDDQAFLLLAVASGAKWLVTGDKDLLALRTQVPLEIVTPAEFLAGIRV